MLLLNSLGILNSFPLMPRMYRPFLSLPTVSLCGLEAMTPSKRHRGGPEMDQLRGERGLVPGAGILSVQDSIEGTVKGWRATTTYGFPPIPMTAGLS